MYIAAYISLLIAFLASLCGAGFALIDISKNNLLLNKFWVKNLQWLICFCFLFASACLLHSLFWGDYRLEYTASYTDSFLPLFYKLTAFWAGQPGSLLFWGLITVLTGNFWSLTKAVKKVPEQAFNWFWVFFYTIIGFFCLLLTSFSNPFIMLEPTPLDGQGLNPLLQNPGMIIHPPLLFMGYAFFTVPSCLGLASLLTESSIKPIPLKNNRDPSLQTLKIFLWFQDSNAFILLGWIFLTAGILLGAWWAYMELGWGGYWAWDPVENASLLPWLSATAAIHILIIQKKYNKLGRVSVFLIVFTLILSFFGTYLTRSGIIQSVHAFGEGGVGLPLLIFILCSTFITLLVCASAKTDIKILSPLLSREGSILLLSWLMGALILIVMLATLWPVFSQIATQNAIGLEPSFYNKVCLPLGTFAIFLLALCPCQQWQAPSILPNAKPKIIISAALFLITIILLWFFDYRNPISIFAIASAVCVIFVAFFKFLTKKTWKNSSALAAIGAHAGIALISIGVAFSGPYSLEKDFFLAKNESAEIGSYKITLEKISESAGKGFDSLQITMKVFKNGDFIGYLYPERRIYHKFGSMQFSEVDVISSLSRDIYSSLLGMDETHSVMVKISIEPLINWIWIGGGIMCILPLISLILTPYFSRKIKKG